MSLPRLRIASEFVFIQDDREGEFREWDGITPSIGIERGGNNGCEETLQASYSQSINSHTTRLLHQSQFRDEGEQDFRQVGTYDTELG